MTTDQRLRRLEFAFIAFVALHAIVIPLLPRLFSRAPEVTTGAMVLGVVLLVLWVGRRRGGC